MSKSNVQNTYVWKCYNETFIIVCQLKFYDDDNNLLDNFIYFACPISVSRIPTEKNDSNYGFFVNSFFFNKVGESLFLIFKSFIFRNQDVRNCSRFC